MLLFGRSSPRNLEQETEEELLEDLDDIAVDNTVTLQLGTVIITLPEYHYILDYSLKTT